jgi:cytochrome c oxidase assembly protein subunit 15
MVLGGYTSAVGAGLACPDWPLCNNAVLPDLANPAIAAEFAHRIFALSASVLILASLLFALLWYRRERRLLALSIGSFVLLAGQIALGALTITSRLDPVIVTSHLAIASSTFAATLSLVWVTLLAPPGVRRGEPTAA